MAFIPALITGLGALGGLFGGSSTKQNQNTNQTNQFLNSQTGINQSTTASGGTSNITNNQLTTPVQTQQGQDFLSQLIASYAPYLGNSTNLQPYQASQTENINQQYNQQEQNTRQMLAARGITGPAAALANQGQEQQRYGQITQLNQQIPLLQNQLTQQALGIGTSIFGQIPRGTSTTGGQQQNVTGSQQTTTNTNNVQQGVSNTVGNNTSTSSQGNPLGGLFGNLGSILAALYGGGYFNNGSSTVPGINSTTPSASTNQT